MGDITATCPIVTALPSLGGPTCLYFETPATADHNDTLVIDLTLYGATTIKGFLIFRHSTTNSVLVADDAATTSVSAAYVLTLTIGAGGTTDDKKRSGFIWVQ